MISLKIKSGRRQCETYNSLHDLPVFNWFSSRYEEKFSYLLKDRSLHYLSNEELFKKFPKIDFELQFLELVTEFFDEFGKPKEYDKEIRLKSEIIDLNLKFAETGQRMILNGISILQNKLNALMINNVDVDFKIDIKKEIAAVSKASGVMIDTRKINTIQYYTQRLLLLENG